MAKIGKLGVGTFSIIILLIVLIILLILYICKVPAMKYIFWIYLIGFIVTIIVLFTLPLEKERIDEDGDEYNDHFPKILVFGISILAGLIVSFILYFYVVLLHENTALVVPNYS